MAWMKKGLLTWLKKNKVVMLGLVLLFAAILLGKYFPANDGAGMISTAAVLDVTEEPAEVEMNEEEADESTSSEEAELAEEPAEPSDSNEEMAE